LSTTEPSISIVTACYNSTPFLDRIYESLEKQTYRNFEWVCVDDASTDDTVARLISLKSPGALGMQVYKLPQNTGGPVALGVGTQRARGDIVIWLDHDDALEPFALEQVRNNWWRAQADESVSGMLFWAIDAADGRPIGRHLPPGTKLTWSEQNNRYPDICDCTFAFKREQLQRFATVEAMEDVILNGVVFERMTAAHPFVTADGPPIRYYFRDNPASQTRLERISRKTVATYARLLDQSDLHYVRSPMRWLKHAATLLRYSRIVHGRWLYCLRYISRAEIRILLLALLPFGLVAYLRRPNANIVDAPFFPAHLADGLDDLWLGDRAQDRPSSPEIVATPRPAI